MGCQTSLVMTVNGPSVKSNPSTWVRSNAKPINACFTVWKVSWSKATEKPNVKRTKMVNGNSTRNSVHVSNVVMTAQKLRNQKNPCATMKTKIVKKNQKNPCARMKTKWMKTNHITMIMKKNQKIMKTSLKTTKTSPKKTTQTCMMTKKSPCAKKMRTVKKNQIWTARSPIWKICQTSSVMMANGLNANPNQSIWANSNVKPINACFIVWKVSWLKVMTKPSAKRTKMENGNSLLNFH